MSVQGVTSGYTHQAAQTAAAKAAAGQETAKSGEETSAQAVEAGDTYETGKAAAKTTYKPDMETIKRLKADVSTKTAAFRQMVEKLFTGQAGKQNEFYQMLGGAAGDKNPDIMIDIDPETRAAAQAEIGEDGYWGVKQTSQRILDFATALSGGDPSKLDLLEKAFEDGYAAASGLLGGKLPDISRQTYDAVKKGFSDLREQAGVSA